MTIRSLLGILIVLNISAGAMAEEGSPQSLELHEVEARLIDRTNAIRQQHGLRPLALCPSLMRSARRHTAWMCDTHTLAHGSGGQAENIARGQTSVDAAISTWMHSPGHRANLLSGSYGRIGVAAYRSPSGTVYWCQQFRR